jgi:hypothetical protein
MSKRLRGEPEKFWPRLKWWLRQDYLYWDRVECIERDLKCFPEMREVPDKRITQMAKLIASGIRIR